jgi:dihydroxyacid dehydratase/phosphogluconate dehydratase
MATTADHGRGRRLRSADWFGEPGRMGAIYRSWVRGYTPEVFDRRPVIGIANSWSELTPCNAHLRRVADAVKQGVWQAGGFPLEFPTTSLGETLMRPTAMLFRNLMSMDVEETLRANPLDGVVLLSGCDKTTPAMLMGPPASTCPPSWSPAGRCCRASSRAATSARAPTSGGSARRSAPGGCQPRTSARPRAAWPAATATA